MSCDAESPLKRGFLKPGPIGEGWAVASGGWPEILPLLMSSQPGVAGEQGGEEYTAALGLSCWGGERDRMEEQVQGSKRAQRRRQAKVGRVFRCKLRA